MSRGPVAANLGPRSRQGPPQASATPRGQQALLVYNTVVPTRPGRLGPKGTGPRYFFFFFLRLFLCSHGPTTQRSTDHGAQQDAEWAWVAPLASPRHARVNLARVRPFPPIFMGKGSLTASCAGPSSTNPTASPQLPVFLSSSFPQKRSNLWIRLRGPGHHRVPLPPRATRSPIHSISFVARPFGHRVLCRRLL